MEDHNSPRRPSLGVVIGLVAVMLTAGSAAAWFTWQRLSPQPPTADFPELELPEEDLATEPLEANPPTSDAPASEEAPAATATEQAGQIYWVQDQAGQIVLVPRAVETAEAEAPAARLRALFAELMAGPEGATGGPFSAIPPDTELLDLSVQSDGVHVNLSQSFTQGGGSAAMMGRLAQVVYTATTLDPETPVWLSVAGEPLTLLGGEGLIIPQPITRADVADDFGVTPTNN